MTVYEVHQLSLVKSLQIPLYTFHGRNYRITQCTYIRKFRACDKNTDDKLDSQSFLVS